MNNEKKRVLMVVFEFPPSNGSSIQRILSVYNGFVSDGWDVDVITAKEYAYDKVSPFDQALLPENKNGNIVRTLALDVMRHLAFKGKHLQWMIKPDRWGLTWIPSALAAGKKLVSQKTPDLIWSSAPTPSPHVIARKLAEVSGAKWIADYRDPMPYLHRPTNTKLDILHKEIDLKNKESADVFTFATEETMKTYQDLFSDNESNFYKVMKNGFDSELMEQIKLNINQQKSIFSEGKLSLYYAGVLYDNGRDPRPLFDALFKIKSEGAFDFELVFQGSGDGTQFKEYLNERDLSDNVKFISGVSFKEALINMLKSDVLVLIQGEKFNRQIPGKVYEYLASGKSILLQTPTESATSNASANYDGVWLGESENILHSNLIEIFMSEGYKKDHVRDVSEHSRKKHVKKLIEWSNNLITSPLKKC